ncbi:hypothetical protein [Curtobacterium sp. SORGH_AS_0776]|uniref:hypothetical protein n=1 Tax=Curtobacterium sp. SORGH_AS_0776 TaxID=3041798 RepID=UPI002865EA6F|nr:hypothetical protein [Curtobacterium sp. SORGH_AS_0776]MDR6172635.1 hypothetical protein [Curtobacterium sp. SORGH_AS_0776]
MMDQVETIWGYRLEDGTEVWEVDHGHDGIWTPALPAQGIPAIDLYSGQERDAIRKALNNAGHVNAEVMCGDLASGDLSEIGVSQSESTPDTH